MNLELVMNRTWQVEERMYKSMEWCAWRGGQMTCCLSHFIFTKLVKAKDKSEHLWAYDFKEGMIVVGFRIRLGKENPILQMCNGSW